MKRIKTNRLIGLVIVSIAIVVTVFYIRSRGLPEELSQEPIIDNRFQITDQEDAKYQSSVLVNSTEVEDAYGTGYVVNEYTVVTNRHVVMEVQDDYSRVVVRAGHKDKNGSVHFIDFKVKKIIVPQAEEIDVAVIKLEKREDGHTITDYRKAVEFGDARNIKKGTLLTVVGFPGDKEYATMWDSTGKVDVMMGQMFAFKAITQGGNSGSPMFDSDGKVVAMNNAGGENNSFGFILDETIVSFIRKNAQ